MESAISEEWVSLHHLGYPNYEISNFGNVRNVKKHSTVRIHPNQNKNYHVGLYRNGHRTNFSLGRLVAKIFLPRPENELFDTVVHRDGRTHNNRVENLEWRPYWFAKEYQMEFNDYTPYPVVEVVEETTGLTFKSGRLAASYFCVLESDVHRMCNTQQKVTLFPELIFKYKE